MNKNMKILLNSNLFHGSLEVPKWSDFWKRYLILLCLGVGVLGLTLCQPLCRLWLQWDQAAGTVTSFGITLYPGGIETDLHTAVNDVYEVTSSVLYFLYILLVIMAYGPKRFWKSATHADMKRVLRYVLGLCAILILGGYVFGLIGGYSGDPIEDRSFVMVFMIGVVGPIMEELFARFTLFQMLRAKTHFLVAAIVSSIVFGLLHFGYPEPIKMVMAGLAGTLLCWCYEKTDSILTPIGIHVLNNLWMQLA